MFFKKIFKTKYRVKELLKLVKKEQSNFVDAGLWLIDPNDLKKRDNLYNDYKNLIAGMDDESIFTVNKLLAKLMTAKVKQNQVTLSLNNEDIEIINKVNFDFFGNILELPNCFAYKNYFLPKKHFEASVLYFKHGIDTLNNLNQIMNKNIIDVGGFIGDSAIVFSKYTTQNVFSFEPSKKNYDLMLETINLNDSCNNIFPIKNGLGSKNEKISLNYRDCGSYIGAPASGTVPEEIEIITLDDFVNSNNIDVGLIKVDIEGFEQEFLEGAKNTIKNQKPALIISIYHNFDDFFYIKPIIESWDLGYKFRVYAPLLNPLFLETLLIAEV